MTDDHKKAYQRLLDLSKQIHLLDTSMALLEWDQKTYMPKGGTENRGNQLALLAGMSHQRATAPEIGELLNQLENSPLSADEDSFEAANIREIKHRYDKLVKVPQSLVEELTRVTTIAHDVWADARKKSDFSIFLPYLEKIIKLKHQQAEAVGYEKHPYDALLDDFEPGATIEKVAKVFADFRQDLVGLVKSIADSGRKPDVSFLKRNYPADRQASFGKEASAAIGYDWM
jgi:carboxypeptidase Taq